MATTHQQFVVSTALWCCFGKKAKIVDYLDNHKHDRFCSIFLLMVLIDIIVVVFSPVQMFSINYEVVSIQKKVTVESRAGNEKFECFQLFEITAQKADRFSYNGIDQRRIL